MIEQYNLENSNLSAILNNIMENTFFYLIMLLTICIFFSLTIWLIGAKIKSEKTIKFGIKSFIISILIQVLVLVIPFLISLIK